MAKIPRPTSGRIPRSVRRIDSELIMGEVLQDNSFYGHPKEGYVDNRNDALNRALILENCIRDIKQSIIKGCESLAEEIIDNKIKTITSRRIDL